MGDLPGCIVIVLITISEQSMNQTSSKLVLLVLFAVTGCSSLVGSQNVDFVPGQSQVTAGKNTVVICRPSAFNNAFDSAGVTINNSPVTELGSGQIYSIDVVSTSRLDLQITLPVTDLVANMWKPPTTFNLKLNPRIPTNFVLLTVNSESEAVPSYSTNPRDMAFQSTATWTGRSVDAKTLLEKCGNYNPRFLVVKTLPQIAEKGVLPTTSGVIVPAVDASKPTPAKAAVATAKGSPVGVPLIKSNQISQRYLNKIGYYGKDNGSYWAYIDVKSAVKHQGAIEVNVVKEYAVEQSSPVGPYNNEVDKLGIDCKSNQYRLIETAKYLSVSDTSPELDKKDFTAAGLAQWRPNVPGTLADSVANRACELTLK